jgi:ATP-dependent DNA helicase RecQ
MFESSNFKCLEFLLCLHFAVVNSEYVSVVLKPKQVMCLEAAYIGKDLLAVLPTGYGKSVIFHLLPSLLAKKKRRAGIRGNDPVIIVIFPLNSLIQDQLQRINAVRTRTVVLSVKGNYNVSSGEQLNLDLANVDKLRLKNADYEYVLTHPETCLSTKQGVALFQSDAYKYSVTAVVVDEAHCIY